MSLRVIPISKPVLGEEEKAAVLAVLESGQLAQGPKVAEFEEAFARECGVPEAIAVSSGTAALIVSLLAHDVGPGDEVITTPFSFIASANAILLAGAKPVFVDVDPSDFNINVERIADQITPATKAILPVHLYGYPCHMDAIIGLAKRHNLIVIEDCSQAHGATVDGRKAGSFGTGCFSFYATKNMTTGEGGMITTSDPAIARRCRLLRNHGATARYHHETLGSNWRMSEFAAALGLAQLKKLPLFTEARRSNAAYLSASLESVATPTESPGYVHVYHQYTMKVSEGMRDRLQRHLMLHGVESAVHYPLPIHQQPLYQHLGYRESLPESERLSRHVLSVPVHPALSRQDLEKICASVNSFVERESP